MKPDFEILKKVDPRKIWKHEAHDFTPWLADNLDQLGDAIGMELQLLEREASVGGFSLDLLARDLGSNSTVIIENQLATTDHDHLGKLITYASGYDADIVMWVSTGIREEHRQALDWLNQRTDSNTDFFGIVVEVIRIGESKPALQFRVAVSPNEWQKSKRHPQSTSGKSELYRDYFQKLIDELRDKHHFTSARKGQPQNWYSFSSGDRRYQFSHSFTFGDRVRTELYIDNGDKEENMELFNYFLSKRELIEANFAEPVEWEPLESKRACRIAVYRDGSIEDSSEKLEEIRMWAVQNLLLFKKVFGDSITVGEN